MAVSHEVALRDELLRSRDHDIATLTIALREARAENERLRAALKPFARIGRMLIMAGAKQEDEVELSGEELRPALLAAAQALPYSDEQSGDGK